MFHKIQLINSVFNDLKVVICISQCDKRTSSCTNKFEETLIDKDLYVGVKRT